MTEEDLEGTVVPATRSAILREYVDGSLAVRVIIAPQDKQAFMKLLPDVDLPIFIVRQDPRHARLQLQQQMLKGPYGQQARALRLHVDWMGNTAVWRAVGSDEDYLAWCRLQACAACKDPPPSEAAHVRRIANGAGTAIKPPYSAIPLCSRCHRLQHQQGESAIGGKEFIDKLRIRYVQGWVWERMRVIFGVESMSQAEPRRVFEWAMSKGLDGFLPACYREAE